jgi:hypothetical protein
LFISSFYFAFLPLLLKFHEKWKTHVWKAQQLPHFWINFRINMAGFVDSCKVVARKSAFSGLPIQVHEMKVKTVNLKNH